MFWSAQCQVKMASSDQPVQGAAAVVLSMNFTTSNNVAHEDQYRKPSSNPEINIGPVKLASRDALRAPW